MNDNGSFRKKKVYFAQVSNEALRDPNLSLKSKGLYALIQSYITIENFTLYKNKLKKDCAEGKKAFEAAWKELKDKGYLVQYKLQNEKGTFYYEYDLLDISQIPKKEGVDQNPKKEHMDFGGVEKGGAGKGGIYNNTDPNNTNSNNTKGKKKEVSLSSPIDNFFKSIKAEMTDVSFKTWVEPLEIKESENKIIVIAPDETRKSIVKDRYSETIQKHLKKYFEFSDLEVISTEKLQVNA